jgi:hypothetical protein
MLWTRDQELVLAWDRGETTVALAERYGISHQRVSYLVARATEFVNRVDLDLMVARKTGEVLVYDCFDQLLFEPLADSVPDDLLAPGMSPYGR